MWHGRKAGLAQLDTGGDNIVMSDAARMIDEYRSLRRQQFVQPLSQRVIVRRNLDRGRTDQFRDAVLHPSVDRPPLMFHDGARHPESRLREIT